MAMTHGLTLAMVSAYIPNTKVPGLGRVNGTAWSFTDFVFGMWVLYDFVFGMWVFDRWCRSCRWCV